MNSPLSSPVEQGIEVPPDSQDLPSTQPSQPQPDRSSPSRALSARAIASIVIGATLATLVCSGGIAWLVVLGLQPAHDVLARANLVPPRIAAKLNGNDWMTQHVLAPIYTETLDTVVADPQVIEHLGEPVETDIAADELYRLSDGALRSSEDVIEYDLVGSKARGTVRVTIHTASELHPGWQGGSLHIKEIKVTCEDGKVIQVNLKPPAKANMR